MQNYDETVISQYSNAPTLCTLLYAFNQWIDPAADIDDFYNKVWNVATAEGYGLDVWGRIVGIGRVIAVAGTKYFGFEEATSLSADPFNQSPFYRGQRLTDNVILSDNGFRTLILAKALSNICDGSIPGINAVLLLLFPNRGNCYVTDGRDMTMTYTFEFPLSPLEVSIVQGSGVLPKPSGVQATVVIAPGV